MVAVPVTASIGDYRAGDEIWCRRFEGDWTSALNRDLLVPRPAGRFFFARLLNVDGEKLHLLPLGTGQRQQVVSNPPWEAVAVRLIRTICSPFAVSLAQGRSFLRAIRQNSASTGTAPTDLEME